MDKKVTVIGAGNVGSSLALMAAQASLADVVLYDVVEGMPQGKALDIQQACPLWGSASRVAGTNDIADTVSSDVVVITAGLARKPGMSRDDLLQANADIMKSAAAGVKEHSPNAIVIIVTNPMDVMAQLAWRVTGFPSERVIGMGGVLDSTRLRAFISMELDVSPEDIDAIVLGGHGDQMVPLVSKMRVKGLPLSEFVTPKRLGELVERTKFGGAEIVSLLKTGSAYYAPAASTLEMLSSVLRDERRLLPCAVCLDGQYGVKGLYVGVPVVLGSRGVEKIIEVEMDADEDKLFRASVDAVGSLIAKLGI